MNILVTGGTGYIGSHTLIALYEAGHTAVVVDNLINSSRESLRRVEALVDAAIPFVEADLRDDSALETIFSEHQIDGVIHFAGLKAVVLLGLLLTGGQRVMRWWLTIVARRKSEELFVLNLLLVTLSLAWLTELA